jgi:uncharacterized protein (TIRG00374 family)
VARRLRPLRGIRTLVLAAGVAGTAGFGYVAVRNVHFPDAWRALETSNYWWTLPALATLGLAVVLRAARWGFLFRPDRRPPLSALTQALLVSYFFNSILPARAGEVARVIDLKRRTGTSRAETAATVVLERVYDVIALLLLLFALFPWMPHLGWIRAASALAALLAAGLLAAIAALTVWGERPLLVVLRPLRWAGVSKESIGTIAGSVGHGLAAIRDLRLAVLVLGWTIVSWLVASLSGWLLMFGFGLHLSFVAALLVAITGNLSQVLPSLPSGLGVFEAATVVALKAYDVSDARALSYALVLHALNFVPFVAVGPIVLGPRRIARDYPLEPEASERLG